MPANRDESGRFVKGKSGNPSGRPKVPDSVRDALRDLVPASIAIKRQILTDADASLDLKNKVADSVLDRVYGKPVGVSPEDGAAALDKLDEIIAGMSCEAEQ